MLGSDDERNIFAKMECYLDIIGRLMHEERLRVFSDSIMIYHQCKQPLKFFFLVTLSSLID